VTGRLYRGEAGYSARMETGSQSPESSPGGGQPPSSPQAPPSAGPPAPSGQPPAPAAPQPAQRTGYTGGPLAGWGSRVGAALIDGLITTIPIWIGVGLVFAGKGGIGSVLILLGLVIAFLYYPMTMQRPAESNGQTIGKQLLNIRVRRDSGEPFDFGSALLREFVIKYLLFNVVGSFFFYIPTLLDILWPLWDEENRALHDMLAKSHVVTA
jgi:uncharacterized RDD family membrane protein YckC